MRLVTYAFNGSGRAGVVINEWVVDAAAASSQLPAYDWSSTRSIIQAPLEQRLALAQSARDLAQATPPGTSVLPLANVKLYPPIPNPEKIICMGLNYRSHAEEAGFAPPTVPILFAKYPNALVGSNNPILLPGLSEQVDYEGELAVVMGRRCKGVNAAAALDYVAGYMAFNDVSARDLQFRSGQWLSGKTLDTFAPCGPVLVVDEIADPQTLRLTTRLNDQTVQDGQTGQMIFSVAESIAYISQLITLEPGDIIATGTPDGVGFKRKPPLFLKAGDVVEVEIEGIGTLRNPVAAA